jgi:signal transduction histidine kinase
LREIVQQSLELIRTRALHQGVRRDVQLPRSPVSVNGDRCQLSAVVLNLLINALDAMPEGGWLKVVLFRSPDEGVRLEVHDTGTGIAEGMMERIFNPFVTTKAEGTGLGLSIAKRIIEEHGGRITAANRPKGGALFTFTLPDQESLLGDRSPVIRQL